MSGRMLQRALKEQQAQPSSILEDSTWEDLKEDENHVQKPVRNMFDLLGSEDNEAENADDKEDELETKREAQTSVQNSAPKKSTTTANATKSKKKNNKGKNKGKPSTALPVEPTPVKDEESVDELLEKLALQNGETASASETTTSQPVAHSLEVMGVDPRYLRAEDELRRIFGSKVIHAVERSREGGNMLSGRKRQPPKRGGRGLLKKTLLVTPLEHWPRPEGGLSMVCTDTKEGLNFFRYELSSSYQAVQKQYEECVGSHDPNTIVMIVNQHPYHIDSLLTLAEVYKHMGETQKSSGLLERCLYALECAWHPWFNPANGKCRLDYSWDANKPLFYALFKHMQHLGRRGCHRTALEVCKLLLSLDSDDPMGALFCIDYFALRAEQYQWLQRFVREYGAEQSLPLLPSFSLSVALAQFHIESQRSESSSIRTSSGKISPLKQGSSAGDEDSSLDLLQQALMLHPSLLRKIVDKAPIKEDAAWGKILKHNHFSWATMGGPSLKHLIDIYIERNFLVWRAPDVQAWLKKGAQSVVDIADRQALAKDGGEIANWACVCKEAFPADQNEYQHLVVSEFSDSTSTLPPEEMQQQFGLPGGLAGGAGHILPQHVLDGIAATEMELEGQNSLVVFLQSLLPWFNQGVDLQGQELPVHEEGADDDPDIDVELVGEGEWEDEGDNDVRHDDVL